MVIDGEDHAGPRRHVCAARSGAEAHRREPERGRCDPADRLRPADEWLHAAELGLMRDARQSRLRPGRAGDLRPRRHDRPRRRAHSRGRGRTAPASSSSRRRSFPPTPHPRGRRRSPAGPSRARRRRSRCSTASRSRFQDRTPTGSRDRARARRLARDRRQRDRPGTARDALQLAPLLLARGRAGAPPPQARADEPRAARLGPGRRPRTARDRDADRPARRTDLLGELHAAGAVLALRVRRRDLHRLDRRRRRLVAGDARPHRAASRARS